MRFSLSTYTTSGVAIDSGRAAATVTDVGKGTYGGWAAIANVVGHVTTGTLISPVLTVVDVVLIEVPDRVIAAVFPPPQLVPTSESTKTPTSRIGLRRTTPFSPTSAIRVRRHTGSPILRAASLRHLDARTL